jgi:hypothetical protein
MPLMPLHRITWVVLLCTTLAAWADDAPIGYVKTLTGSATITTRNTWVNAQLGTQLFEGSLLKTGPKSSMGVTFKDDTVMSFGADTELTVDAYLYAPSQGKFKLGSSLARGSLNYVSGAIAKLQPDAVSVKTPTGTIGVRGTQFVVKVEDTQK